MSVIEKLSIISETITKIMNFVVTNEVVKPDFEEYLTTVAGQNRSKMQALMIPYIFERRLTENKRTILELFKLDNRNLSKEEIEIIDCLSKSSSSIFEVRRVLSNGFELYNLINEKKYHKRKSNSFS